MKPTKKQTPYQKKLLDPRWQKKRLETLQRDGWACQSCGDTESTLHVHHRRYLSGNEPWDIDSHLLVTLCDACHESEKAKMKENIGDLVLLVKEHFLSADVASINEGLAFLTQALSPAHISNILRKVLQSEKAMKHIDEYCSEHLTKKTTTSEGDEVF
jgi:cytochrome c553